MYTRILTPLDGSDLSEQVLPHTRGLASRLSLSTTLLLAIEPDHPSIGQSLNPSLHSHETESHREGHTQEYLNSVATRLEAVGISASTRVPRGEPAGAIVEEAAKEPQTLIAMASHGRSGLARWWMGSVADKVLHMTDNPLLIIRSQNQPEPDPERIPRQVIVSLDGSELAELSLPHVAYIASRLEIPVYLVHVTLSESEYNQSMSSGLRVLPPTAPTFQTIATQLQTEAQEYVESVKHRLLQEGVPSVEERLLQGSPADRIADLSLEFLNSMVVMTTHGRSGVGRVLLGSVAERVVRHSGCPVLLIRAGTRGEAPLTNVPAPE